MVASKYRLVPLLLLLSLTCSCRSVVERAAWKSIEMPVETISEFEKGEFASIATYPEIRRLASSQSVVFVWMESPSEFNYLKASRAPAGQTVSAILRALREKHFFFPGESEVTIIGPKGQSIADGGGATEDDAESDENPLLQPGSVVFLDQPPPVVLLDEAVATFRSGEFEQLAAHPAIRRLASPRSVVVVWCESISELARVRALRIPAGKTVSESLGIPPGQKLSSNHGQLPMMMPVAPSGISRVVILVEGRRLTLDGSDAISSEEETEQNPLLQPGAIVFVGEGPPSVPSLVGERGHGTGRGEH